VTFEILRRHFEFPDYCFEIWAATRLNGCQVTDASDYPQDASQRRFEIAALPKQFAPVMIVETGNAPSDKLRLRDGPSVNYVGCLDTLSQFEYFDGDSVKFAELGARHRYLST
jgi:hypothetical protein